MIWLLSHIFANNFSPDLSVTWNRQVYSYFRAFALPVALIRYALPPALQGWSEPILSLNVTSSERFYVINWMFMPLSHSYAKTYSPTWRYLEVGTFERGLGYEGSALMKTSESFLIPPTMWHHREKMIIYEPGSPYLIPNLPEPWSWTSQTPECWEITFCCL